MTPKELIQEIHTLNRELEFYESKYDLLSRDFYLLYMNGDLPDEDIEQIDEYGRWAAFYKIKLERATAYEQLVEKRLIKLRASVHANKLTPLVN